jgi:hypothetical protein
VRILLATLPAILVGCSVSASRAADEPEVAPGDSDRQAIAKVAEGCQLFLGKDRIPLKFDREPMLRWPNPTRGIPDGATFVWTLDGRPEAIGCVWRQTFVWYSFHSVSSSKLVAEYNGRTIWQSQKAGVEFAVFSKAPQPADSTAKRLLQMKELARRFSCRLSNGGDGEELRLLPRPVYRYQVDRADLKDGALFAFVQGTDPEVVLVLEATRHHGRSQWQYALTRRTPGALEADLDGQRIWTVPRDYGGTDEVWCHGHVGTAP